MFLCLNLFNTDRLRVSLVKPRPGLVVWRCSSSKVRIGLQVSVGFRFTQSSWLNPSPPASRRQRAFIHHVWILCFSVSYQNLLSLEKSLSDFLWQRMDLWMSQETADSSSPHVRFTSLPDSEDFQEVSDLSVLLQRHYSPLNISSGKWIFRSNDSSKRTSTGSGLKTLNTSRPESDICQWKAGNQLWAMFKCVSAEWHIGCISDSWITGNKNQTAYKHFILHTYDDDGDDGFRYKEEQKRSSFVLVYWSFITTWSYRF